MIFVVFGPPGVGKTSIGRRLAEKRNCCFLDADDLINDHERLLLNRREYRQGDREVFLAKLDLELGSFDYEHQDLILAEAFTIDHDRERFLKKYQPYMYFIYIYSSKSLAAKRFKNRRELHGHILTNEAAHQLLLDFEQPTIPHLMIENNENRTVDEIVERIIICLPVNGVLDGKKVKKEVAKKKISCKMS